MQQFRKKKEKRGPGKKAKADAGAEEGATKAEEPEPKSPVGLKLLAGEGGSGGSTPFEVKLVFFSVWGCGFRCFCLC